MVEIQSSFESPTKTPKKLAKDYIANNIRLVGLYSKKERQFLIKVLTLAQEGTSFSTKLRIVKEARELLSRWNWKDLPSELTGNNKLIIFERLRFESTSSVRFERLYKKITEEKVDLNQYLTKAKEEELNTSAIDSIKDEEGEEEGEEEEEEDNQEYYADDNENLEEFDYFVIDPEYMTHYQITTIAVQICNDSDYAMILIPHKSYLILTDENSLLELDIEDLKSRSEVIIAECEKEGTVIKSTIFTDSEVEENVENEGIRS